MSGFLHEGKCDLVSAKTIARRLGMEPQIVTMWKQRHRSFPLPQVDVDGHRLWCMQTVDAWYQSGRAPSQRKWINGTKTRETDTT